MWISKEDVQKVFMENYRGTAKLQNKLHYVIAEFVPVTFIENSSFMHARIETELEITTDTLVFSKYIKPLHLCKNNQKVAHITLGFNSRHTANMAIQNGLFIEGKHVNIRKKLTDPRRCLKCQKFGHFVSDYKAKDDICARCDGKHRTSKCKVTNAYDFSCSNCTNATAKGHGAADRNCPAFKTELEKLHNRIPDNKYKYFPTNAPRTWSLLGEPKQHTRYEPEQQQTTTTHHNNNQPNPPRIQQRSGPTEDWQSTRRGRPPLTYQDRHYTPEPQTIGTTDTYIPDKGWLARPSQSTLDNYVNRT